MKVLRSPRFVIVAKLVMTTSSFGIIIRERNSVNTASSALKFQPRKGKCGERDDDQHERCRDDGEDQRVQQISAERRPS